MPAFRSAVASARSRTPRRSAPAFRTTFETSTAPWPYASAFTAATKPAPFGSCDFTQAALPAITDRSISTHFIGEGEGIGVYLIKKARPAAACRDFQYSCGLKPFAILISIHNPG